MRTERTLRRGRRGFTLIELLAVIAIMGLLLGLVAVSVSSFLVKAKVRVAKVQIGTFEQALDLYHQTKGKYPGTHEGLEILIKEKLLKADFVPKDPWGNVRAGFRGTLTIDRTDYGLEWNELLETGGVLVGNEVAIQVDVEGLLEE